MPKAFLSHSSKDKNIVRDVFKGLNAANAHYDEETFEDGKTSAENIFNGLSSTDLFVLFISENSLKSRWVQSEIDLAHSKISAKEICSVFVIILDNTQKDKLPPWVTTYVYRKIKNPKLITNAIRSKLIELDVDSASESGIFLGRDDVLSEIKSSLSKPSDASPYAMCISGWDGIGRRTVVKRALSDTFPWISRIMPEIALDNQHGPTNFLEKVLDYLEPLSPNQLSKEVENFEALSETEKGKLLSSKVRELSKAKQVLFVHGHNSIVKDNGDFQPWISRLIQTLQPTNIPSIVFITRRAIPFRKRSNYNSVYFTSLKALSTDSSKEILSQWLKRFTLDFSSDFLNEIGPFVSGHPKNIKLAAEFSREFGVNQLLMDKAEFRDLLTERSSKLLRKIRLEILELKLLSIFGDYSLLSIEDILPLFDPLENVHTSLRYLQEFGILEWESKYLKLASYLVDAISRYKWPKEIEEFRENVADIFYQKIATIDGDEQVTLSTIDSGVLASLRLGKDPSNQKWKGLLLPSHLLRVAREAYDDRKHSLAAELSLNALEHGWHLTEEAKVEAYRLRAISLARLKKTKEFHDCLGQLEKFNSIIAKRNLHFLKGFKNRIEGKVERAEFEYRKAYTYNGDHNFHILRELAFVLILQDRYSESEMYARAAYKIAPNNPYVIDILLAVLIEKEQGKYHLTNNKEIQRLLDELQEESEKGENSFYENRMARYCTKLRHFGEALDWANKAVRATPKIFGVYLTRALIKLDAGWHSNIEEDIENLERISRDPKTGEGKSDRFMLTKIKIWQREAAKDYHGAKALIDKARNVPEHIRNSITSRLATSILSNNTNDPDLQSWANDIVSQK